MIQPHNADDATPAFRDRLFELGGGTVQRTPSSDVGDKFEGCRTDAPDRGGDDGHRLFGFIAGVDIEELAK